MIKRRDLVGISDADYATRQGEFMQCQDCGELIGGTRGDYWIMAIDDSFKCPECGSEKIAIARQVCKIVIVKQ